MKGKNSSTTPSPEPLRNIYVETQMETKGFPMSNMKERQILKWTIKGIVGFI